MLYNRPVLKSRRKELRNNSTPAETKLWSMLQQSNLGGFKFRRQHSVGAYILDFYCPSEGWQLNWTVIHILLMMRLSMMV